MDYYIKFELSISGAASSNTTLAFSGGGSFTTGGLEMAGDTLYDIQEELEGDFEWFYRGTLTNNGNPRHPLYMKSNEPYTWFPVADYAAVWRYAEYY